MGCDENEALENRQRLGTRQSGRKSFIQQTLAETEWSPKTLPSKNMI